MGTSGPEEGKRRQDDARSGKEAGFCTKRSVPWSNIHMMCVSSDRKNQC